MAHDYMTLLFSYFHVNVMQIYSKMIGNVWYMADQLEIITIVTV